MGFWQKLLEKIKVKSENDDFYYKIEQPAESERRRNKRVPFPASFCIFVPDENGEVDAHTTPFLYGDLNNINVTGAAFSVESKIACSPYNAEAEREIKPHMKVVFVFSSSEGRFCGGTHCAPAEREDERKKEIIEDLTDEITAAKVVWVKEGSFGCQFTDPTPKLTGAVQKMIRLWEEKENTAN